MKYEEFKKLRVYAGMQFIVSGITYWLCQINWSDGYLTGYPAKVNETLEKFNRLDVDNEFSPDYRGLTRFESCIVEKVFDPKKEEKS